MDVNILELLGLEELFEGDNIFEVEDILDGVALPPMRSPAMRRRKGMPKTLALALNILVYVLCAAVITVSMIVRFGGDEGSIFGYRIYNVVSGSMTPTPQANGETLKGGFRENDAIIVKNTAP